MVYCIAIPQSKKMENEHINGYEIENSFIEENSLELDEIFNTYVKNSDDTKYFNFDDDEYRALERLGVWEKIHDLAPKYEGLLRPYEEAYIKDQIELEDVLEYFRYLKRHGPISFIHIINKMIKLLKEAIKIGVGVYFFF